MSHDRPGALRRRDVLGLFGGATALTLLAPGEAPAQPIPTSARIVILGAGAAGTALANRLSERLDGARTEPVHHVLEPTLVVRDTAAGPAGGGPDR